MVDISTNYYLFLIPDEVFTIHAEDYRVSFFVKQQKIIRPYFVSLENGVYYEIYVKEDQIPQIIKKVFSHATYEEIEDLLQEFINENYNYTGELNYLTQAIFEILEKHYPARDQHFYAILLQEEVVEDEHDIKTYFIDSYYNIRLTDIVKDELKEAIRDIGPDYYEQEYIEQLINIVKSSHDIYHLLENFANFGILER